jgi:hypothetical protein
MTATDIIALRAANTGKSVKPSWDDSWSNFSAEDVRKFENECESKFNTDAEVRACVAEKMKSGKTGGINWGELFSTGLGAAQNYRDNKQFGNSGTYVPPTETKNNTGLYVGLGIIAVIGVGIGIYFVTKK